MASKPINRGTSWQVKWRQDGHQQSESFATKREAEHFKIEVEAADNHWPPGWVKGRGILTEEEAAEEAVAQRRTNGTPFLKYMRRRVQARRMAGKLGAHQAKKYEQQARTLAGSLLVAPLLQERIDGDDALGELVVENPTALQPLLEEVVNGYTDEHIGEHADYVVLEDLDREAIAAWIVWMRVRGRAWKTIRNYHGMLHGALEQAIDDEIILRNPCRSTRQLLGTGKTRRKVVLEPAEFDLLHRCIKADARDFVEVAVGTGIRFGELTALRVMDFIDGDEPKVIVEEAWKLNPGHGYYRGQPKSEAGVREVPLSLRIAEIVRRHAKNKPPEALLFTAPRGGRIRQNVFGTDRWQPAVKLAQQKGLTKTPVFHDLRHTYISWLRDSGLSDDAIKAMVGHSEASMTGKYGSVTSATAKRASEAIGDILSRQW